MRTIVPSAVILLVLLLSGCAHDSKRPDLRSTENTQPSECADDAKPPPPAAAENTQPTPPVDNTKPPLLCAAESIQFGMSRAEVESKLGKPVYDRFHVSSRPPMRLQSASESFYGELIKYQEWESPCNPFQLTIWYTNDIVEDVDYWEGNQEGARSYRASAKQGAKP